MKRIILIEDDDTTIDIIADFLKDQGYEVYDYNSVEEVNNVVMPDDILIVDVRLGANRAAGLDYIISLREHNPAFNNTKVIFISNFGRVMIEERIRRLNENFIWLDKPIQMSMLIEAIEGA